MLACSFLGVLSLGVLLRGSSVQAQTISDLLKETPRCAQPCFMGSVTSAKCSLVDVVQLSNCMCSNVTLLKELSVCTQTSCSFSDQITARNLEVNVLCAGFPKASRSRQVTKVAIACLAASTPIVIMRCFARYITTNKLWWDDIMALMSQVVFMAMAAMELASAQMGFGSHYWDVDPSFSTILLQLFWAFELGYVFVQTFSKTSILLFYGRVFPSKWFQQVVRGAVIFMIVHFFVFTFILVFQCKPVKAIWDRSITGECINITAVGYTGGALAIFEDLFILVLPLPELWSLQLDKKKRLVLVSMFSIGLFACITSMVRVKYLVSFANSFDTTWDEVDVAIWSLIELLSAIVCGSLPPCRPLFSQWIPSVIKTAKRSYASRSDHSQTGAAQSNYSNPFFDPKYLSSTRHSFVQMPDPPLVDGLSHTTDETGSRERNKIKGKNRIRRTVDFSIDVVGEQYEMNSMRTKESIEKLYY